MNGSNRGSILAPGLVQYITLFTRGTYATAGDYIDAADRVHWETAYVFVAGDGPSTEAYSESEIERYT